MILNVHIKVTSRLAELCTSTTIKISTVKVAIADMRVTTNGIPIGMEEGANIIISRMLTTVGSPPGMAPMNPAGGHRMDHSLGRVTMATTDLPEVTIMVRIPRSYVEMFLLLD